MSTAQTEALSRANGHQGFGDQTSIDIAHCADLLAEHKTFATLQAGFALEGYQDAESVLEANRQAGLVGERDYYDAKIGFIRLNAEAQRRILEEDNKTQNVLLTSPNVMTQEREAINTRIKDNTEKMVLLSTKAAVDVELSTRQQASAQRALAAAYEQTRSSAEDYLRVLSRTNSRDLAGIGLGAEERARQQGRFQISDKYDDDRARVEAKLRVLRKQQDGELTKEQQDRYDQDVAVIAEFREKALAEYDDYYKARKEQEANAANGAAEAIANYVDNQRNAAKSLQEAYESSFHSIEDTLAEFIKTGKLNFKSLADSILAEMARVEARRIVAGYSTGIGSLLGLAFNVVTGGGLSVDTSGAGVSVASRPS